MQICVLFIRSPNVWLLLGDGQKSNWIALWVLKVAEPCCRPENETKFELTIGEVFDFNHSRCQTWKWLRIICGFGMFSSKRGQNVQWGRFCFTAVSTTSADQQLHSYKKKQWCSAAARNPWRTVMLISSAEKPWPEIKQHPVLRVYPNPTVN